MAGSGTEATIAGATLGACRLFADLDDATLDLVAGALQPRRFRLRLDGGDLVIPDAARLAMAARR